jgi:hypothetical protein
MILRAAAGMLTSGKFLKRTLRRTRAERRRPLENRVALGGGFLGGASLQRVEPSVTSCRGGIAQSRAYHSAKEQLRDHQFTEDVPMSDVPRASRPDADGEPVLRSARCLASLPAQTRRPNMRRDGNTRTPQSVRRERPSNMSTPPDDLSLWRLQGDGEQVLKPVRATSRCPPWRTAKAEMRFGFKSRGEP